jgi:Ca2+-binding RTX toxin-like protein
MISSIENIYGSVSSDTLIGDNQSNVINAVGGTDTIQGNNGNDIFIFPLVHSSREY